FLRGVGIDLGVPTSDETPCGDGTYVPFQNGALFCQDRVVGSLLGNTSDLNTFWGKFNQLGGVGVLGLPTGGVEPGLDGMRYQSFEHGVMYYKAATGTHAVLDQNGFLTKWNRGLGLPTGDQQTSPDGVQYQTFQHGVIYYTAATGTHAVV